MLLHFLCSRLTTVYRPAPPPFSAVVQARKVQERAAKRKHYAELPPDKRGKVETGVAAHLLHPFRIINFAPRGEPLVDAGESPKRPTSPFVEPPKILKQFGPEKRFGERHPPRCSGGQMLASEEQRDGLRHSGLTWIFGGSWCSLQNACRLISTSERT
jgi:hypothetical protein